MQHTLLFIILLIGHSLFASVEHVVIGSYCDHTAFDMPNEFSSCSYQSIELMGGNFDIVTESQGYETDGSDIVGPSLMCLYATGSLYEISFDTRTEGYAPEELIHSTTINTFSNVICPAYDVYEPWAEIGDEPFQSIIYDLENYIGFFIQIGADRHYGWMKISWESGQGNLGSVLEEIAIETTPNYPIVAGSIETYSAPSELDQSYNDYGILLTWAPYTNSVACQVRGGLEDGSDPYNFIVQGNEPTQLFINGNDLNAGQNYQWKVRCSEGVNPPSGVSHWSLYQYFTYDPTPVSGPLGQE
ncbi:MAG: hypothetical protein HKN39_06220 [Flavobacteriales bacterium]|nr:hypothetical protein [Flavobacteriales bacterium]